MSKPQARQSHGFPLGPGPIASNTSATRAGLDQHRPRLHLEGGPVARHHRRVHYRRPAARRLGTLHHRPAPEQFFPRPAQRMIEPAFVRQQIHKAEIQPVHRHRPRNAGQFLQPADLPKPPARVARLLQQFHRHAARGTQIPPMLTRNAGEVHRLSQRTHAPQPEQLLQVVEGQRRIQLGTAVGRAHAHVGDRHPGPQLRPQVPGFGQRGQRHRRQVRNQLRILSTNRLHHHRIGGADQGAPVFVPPQPQIFLRLPTHRRSLRESPCGTRRHNWR